MSRVASAFKAQSSKQDVKLSTPNTKCAADVSELPADGAGNAKARCEDEYHTRASGDLESMSQQAGAEAAVQDVAAQKGEKSSKKRERK